MGRAVKTTAYGLILACMLCLGAVEIGSAQESGQLGQLAISGTSADSFPTVEVQLYGIDGQGNPVDFAVEPLFITHNGFPVEEVEFAGKVPVGTLTVFLIDAPSGVVNQREAIQEAVKQFGAPGNMQEQLDYVAVYQIGPEGAHQLLAPTQFHNGVQNLFNSAPLELEDGLTALYDSAIAIIDEIPTLTPNPNMATSIVLFSDGTDAVSTLNEPGQVPLRAAAAGIPIHTVLLENPELVAAGQQLGRQYMADIAAGSRAVAAELANPESLSAIWSRIASFREHSLVQYSVPEPASGTFPVVVRLENNQDMQDTSEVTISAAAPSVTINLPLESRALTLPNLEGPVELRLSTDVSWLDGEARDVVAAALISNDIRVADIPPEQLANFVVPIGNLVYGNNRLEVSVIDGQGLQSTSPPVIIMVTEGEQAAVPEELQPDSGLQWPALLGIGLGIAAGLGLIMWLRNRNRSGGSRRRRRSTDSTYPETDAPPGAATTSADVPYDSDSPVPATGAGSPFVMAHLQVMEAQTFMPEEITLGDLEVSIGRSPAQCTVAFRDDITVSRYHAVLRLEGSRYRIYDAGSTSGTYVNDRQVPEYGLQLNDGDEIQLGAVRLRYRQL